MSRFNKYMLSANWLKTIVFNFRMFPFRQAIHLPVLLFGNVDIKDCQGGRCEFIEDISTKELFAQVIVGNVFDHLNGRNIHPYFTRLSIQGVLQLGREVFISGGAIIYLKKNAVLSLGDYVYIGPHMKIACSEKISLEHHVRTAWECQIFDTNFHYTLTQENVAYRITKPIRLCHNVWLGNRVSVMKGANLGAYCILASNSLLNKDYADVESGVFAGSPAKLIKTGCYRLVNFKKERELNEWFSENANQMECIVAKDETLFKNV